MAVASNALQITAVSTAAFVRTSPAFNVRPAVSFGVRNVSRVVAMATKKFSARPAAGGKKSWIPAVKGGGNLTDPEWLDGS
jgi:hypothetical protein